MTIQAEISLYPLRTAELAPALDAFLQRLEVHHVSVNPGPMSSRLTGEAEDVFTALSAAFVESARNGAVVLVAKVSNACPVESAWS